MSEAQTSCHLSTVAGLSAGSEDRLGPRRLLKGWPRPTLDRAAILGVGSHPCSEQGWAEFWGSSRYQSPALRLESQVTSVCCGSWEQSTPRPHSHPSVPEHRLTDTTPGARVDSLSAEPGPVSAFGADWLPLPSGLSTWSCSRASFSVLASSVFAFSPVTAPRGCTGSHLWRLLGRGEVKAARPSLEAVTSPPLGGEQAVEMRAASHPPSAHLMPWKRSLPSLVQPCCPPRAMCLGHRAA